ncbi:MAG: cobalt-precorrin-6A reductase [Pseudomonadota bacterium]
MRVLILGGTSEAMALSRRLATDRRFDVTISLAGRTTSPLPQAVPVRFGGFGGVEGFKTYVRNDRMQAVIDATHPFAASMSANAVRACGDLNMPLISLTRPPWMKTPGDIWIDACDYDAAAASLGSRPKTVFLSVGRLNLSEFAKAPHHTYIARTIDPPGDIPLPPHIRFVFDRGPFELTTETAFLREVAIDVVVSKNSGGPATYPKIEAARNLSLPVVMISRPNKPTGNHVVASQEDAIAALEGLRDHAATPFSLRGV